VAKSAVRRRYRWRSSNGESYKWRHRRLAWKQLAAAGGSGVAALSAATEEMASMRRSGGAKRGGEMRRRRSAMKAWLKSRQAYRLAASAQLGWRRLQAEIEMFLGVAAAMRGGGWRTIWRGSVARRRGGERLAAKTIIGSGVDAPKRGEMAKISAKNGAAHSRRDRSLAAALVSSQSGGGNQPAATGASIDRLHKQWLKRRLASAAA